MSPREDLIKLWARVEAHLRNALTLVDVEPSKRSLIEEFLDHNELGLAFRTLAGALADSATALPPPAYAHLEAAAAEMDLQETPTGGDSTPQPAKSHRQSTQRDPLGGGLGSLVTLVH